MENRHGLIVDAVVTAATGTAERDAALTMLGDLPDGGRITVGGDKNYDTRDFVRHTREMGVTPHVAQYPDTDRARQRDRRAHDAASRLRDQPTETETRRASLRLDEDRRPVAQAPSSRWSARRLDLHLPCGGLQPGPAATTARPAGLTMRRVGAHRRTSRWNSYLHQRDRIGCWKSLFQWPARTLEPSYRPRLT